MYSCIRVMKYNLQISIYPLAKSNIDTEFYDRGSLKTLLLGSKVSSSHLYQLCSKEDVEMAKALMRPSSYFVDNLSKESNFSQEGFVSVPRAFITCNQDLGMPLEFQQWMIQNSGIHEVLEIKDAGHAFYAPKTLRRPPPTTIKICLVLI
ncbi:hypothetical protein K1719_014837 [Acacia pycnantha]|nr:hypothetical protein K1719_014837 [Acacia pycnantha]